MINRQIISPGSIAVIGASSDTGKPGGKVLENLRLGGYKGKLYAVNPRVASVQGIETIPDVSGLPQVDLAILAIAATNTLPVIEILAGEKNTKAFIILSAGFSELSQEGARLEKEIADIIDKTGGCLIGPNCIGVMNTAYRGVFTAPVPELESGGVTLISGSGATAVFIMESGISRGLTFSAVYSMGNSAQTGVEEMVAWLDESLDGQEKPGALLLYFETIKKPDILLRHASSLVRRGVPVVAVKAGNSEAGSRAASSHTGALTGSDEAAGALFRKAGIIRCHSREEMITVASVLMFPRPKGKNFAIVTHAGGPGVMLSDTLSSHGLNVPEIKGEKADRLLEKLFPGSSVKNPIDFLATGTAGQLEEILYACERDFNQVDGSVVIFGSPGLFPVDDVYDVIHRIIRESSKPVYPVLPSVVNVRREIDDFIHRGNVFFPDEVVMGNALGKVMNAPEPNISVDETGNEFLAFPDIKETGYLDPGMVHSLLQEAKIPVIEEMVSNRREDIETFAQQVGFPVVLKAIGPLHKSDAGGVLLNISDRERLRKGFEKLQNIPGTEKIMIQPMFQGIELFAGVKREKPYGHLILFGIGGIFIEVMKDYTVALAPLTENEAIQMIRNLQGYSLIKGTRGRGGVNEKKLTDLLLHLSVLVQQIPGITEMDINPLMAQGDRIMVVDARIKYQTDDE